MIKYKDKDNNIVEIEGKLFVTKDKHGKDVFAGDRVKRINGEPCFVEWFADECRYVLHNNDNYYDIDILELQQGIELIEDTKDA